MWKAKLNAAQRPFCVPSCLKCAPKYIHICSYIALLEMAEDSWHRLLSLPSCLTLK